MSRVRLPWDSRFSTTALANHVVRAPQFTFWNPASGEYVIGGYWRGRRDIGVVMETSDGESRGELVEALLTSLRQQGMVLAVISQDEVDVACSWYRGRGWSILDRLLVYRLSLNRFSTALGRPIAVSHFQPEELDMLMDLDCRAFPWLWQNEPSDFLAYSLSPNVAALVARNGSSMLGYVSFSVRKDRGHLDRLAVHPRFLRKGYGSALLSTALRQMQDSGVVEVRLTTQQANHTAQELYRHYGFARTGDSHEIYGIKLSE